MRNSAIFLSLVIMVLIGGCTTAQKGPRYPYTRDQAVKVMLQNAEGSVRDSTDSGVRVKQNIKSNIVSNNQQSYTIRAVNYTTNEEIIIKCELIGTGSGYSINCDR